MPEGPRVRANLRVAGTGGTALATDVYLPDGDLPVPAVVTRTAHGRIGHLGEGLGWSARGVGFVAQDVRGRYDSEGEWTPYQNERGDGAALAAWVARQPWCDGRVVAAGGSYAAFTAWTMAVEAPASVHGVISSVPAMGLHRVKFEQCGILRLAEHANWWLERADSRTSRDGLVAAMYRHQPDVLRHLPVSELPERLWAELPAWSDVIEHGAVPPDEHVTDADLRNLAAPTLHIGGWYDLLATETIHQWTISGAAATARPPRTLVVGPWDHDLVFTGTTRVGDRVHGRESRIDLGALQIQWLRATLGLRSDPLPRSAVYVVGADTWLPVERWPPSKSTEDWWYAGADGGLYRDPEPAGTAAFTYDPQQPSPSTTPGADRRHLDGRADRVTFTSPPLTAPLTIAGTPEVDLVATTSAATTDWVVRVNERTSAGQVFELARGSAVHPVTASIQMTPIAVRVPAGSRLELEVTSSDFPFLARNLNTGADRYRTSSSAIAHQRIATGARGTRVLLPIAGGAPDEPRGASA